MTTTEALRLQLENANAQVQQLETENCRLHEKYPRSEAADNDSARLRELYEQALRDLQDGQEELEAYTWQVEELGREREEAKRLCDATVVRMTELEGENRRLVEQEAELRRQCERQELEMHRALDAQRQKWEEREARLVGQVESLKSSSRSISAVDRGTGPREEVREEAAAVQPESLTPGQEPTTPRTIDQARVATGGHRVGETPANSSPSQTPASYRAVDQASVATGVQGAPFMPSLEAALLAQYIPPIPKFSGETQGSDSDSFLDWGEQFELVAEACQWTEQAKLVNLATRLKG